MRSKVLGTDALLLGTVVLWAFNFPVTKYLLTHGFAPLSYAVVRYGAGAALFAGVAYAVDRTLAVGRGSWRDLALATCALLVNQVCFVFALDLTTAATAALVLGTTPVFTVLISHLTGVESLSGRFWVAAGTSFLGVGLVVLGSGRELSGDLGGNLLALGMAVTWAAYSVALAPLMRSYSPYRISAVVLVAMWLPLFLIGGWATAEQSYDSLGWKIWLGLAYAIVGPLVLTNLLWFTAIGRVGPSHAAIFANLLPFAAALLAVVTLDESLTATQVAGGALIALGIVIVRYPAPTARPT